MKFYIEDHDEGIRDWLENHSNSDYEYMPMLRLSRIPPYVLIFSSELINLFKLTWSQRILVPPYDELERNDG